MRRVTFGKYAGVRIKGTIPIPPINDEWHLERAEWLTAQVESGGVFGSVQSYDGTGITAGLHQAVAVYPRFEAQGTLFDLLQTIQYSIQETRIPLLFKAIKDRGWKLYSGKLCTENDAVLLRKQIRKEFTGDEFGLMPVTGPGRERAEKWARLFHECFSDAITFDAQQRAGHQWCLNRVRNKLTGNKTVEQVIYDDADLIFTFAHGLGLEKDLAMCVYWSHSVNAPAAAFKRLQGAVNEANPIDKPRDFAKALIRRLGKAQYGRWKWTETNGRYQRTRNAAMKAWPKELFTGEGAIMPRSF